MVSYAYVVERTMVDGDSPWEVVKVFSSESALRPWLATVNQAATNVCFRVLKVPVDFVDDDEPYAIISKETVQQKRNVLIAKADLAVAERDGRCDDDDDSAGPGGHWNRATVGEVLRAKIADAQDAMDQKLMEVEEALGGDGAFDDALMSMPNPEIIKFRV